jgi:hypothetical protein
LSHAEAAADVVASAFAVEPRDEVDQAVRSGGRDQGLGFDFDARSSKWLVPAPMETTASVELALPDAVLLIVAGWCRPPTSGSCTRSRPAPEVDLGNLFVAVAVPRPRRSVRLVVPLAHR